MSVGWGGGISDRNVPHTRVEDENAVQETYKIGKQIGSGSFGNVCLATHIDTQKQWAIKIISKDNKDKDKSSALKLLEREVAILKRVDHEHIIHLEEVFETTKRMYLVMELCSEELAKALKKQKGGRYSEPDVRTIIKKLALAMKYLHQNNIVHRDLKLENILLSQNPNDPCDQLHIKVTDFGLSVVKEGVGHESMMQAYCGTRLYMSPEILDNKTYSEKCDVWAMGVIMFWLLCGHPPFYSNDEEELYKIIKSAELDFSESVWEKSVSEEAKDLIKQMCTIETEKRITAWMVSDCAWCTGKEKPVHTDVMEMMRAYNKNQLSEDSDEGESAILNGEQSSSSNGTSNGADQSVPKKSGSADSSKGRSTSTKSNASAKRSSAGSSPSSKTSSLKSRSPNPSNSIQPPQTSQTRKGSPLSRTNQTPAATKTSFSSPSKNSSPVKGKKK